MGWGRVGADGERAGEGWGGAGEGGAGAGAAAPGVCLTRKVPRPGPPRHTRPLEPALRPPPPQPPNPLQLLQPAFWNGAYGSNLFFASILSLGGRKEGSLWLRQVMLASEAAGRPGPCLPE